jgi:hypothetical protein
MRKLKEYRRVNGRYDTEMEPRKFDIRGWLCAEANMSKIEEVVELAAAEALEHAFKSEDAHCYLPVAWEQHLLERGHPPIIDPLTIALHIPLSNNEAPSWSVNLTDIVNEELEHVRLNRETDPGYFSRGMLRVRDELRVLADKIDADYKETISKKPSSR